MIRKLPREYKVDLLKYTAKKNKALNMRRALRIMHQTQRMQEALADASDSEPVSMPASTPLPLKSDRPAKPKTSADAATIARLKSERPGIGAAFGFAPGTTPPIGTCCACKGSHRTFDPACPQKAKADQASARWVQLKTDWQTKCNASRMSR